MGTVWADPAANLIKIESWVKLLYSDVKKIIITIIWMSTVVQTNKCYYDTSYKYSKRHKL